MLAVMCVAAAPPLQAKQVPSGQAPPAAIARHETIELRVDATDVQRGIFRVRERIPLTKPGRLTLLYPKWLPGYHAPAGPIDKLAGLVMTAGTTRLQWSRDPRNVFAFHVDVPEGADSITLEFQFLSPTTPQQGRIAMTPDMLALEWHSVLLYPQGEAASLIRVAPMVRLPDEWRFATSLNRGETGAWQHFAPVSLATLVDSPLYAGRHFRRFALDPDSRSPVHLNVMADSPEQIALDPARLAAHRRLVEQADRLFGSRPFERYEFLVTLSDRLGGYGLEHRGSSENSIAAESFLRWDRFPSDRLLLPHEYVHSWNGKLRRADALLTEDFHQPVSNELLWVYEGLTAYWALVLAARSGLRSPDQARQDLAELAARAEHRAGRSWRPLADTLNDPIIGRNAPLPWPNWQRGGDYYSEGPLLWLDVDTRIRELSGERRSLDDFARAFFRGNSRSAPRGYDLDDIVEALDAVQPYDWRSHLTGLLNAREAPLDGIVRGGGRLIYTAVQNDVAAAVEQQDGRLDLSYSLGAVVAGDGTLSEVLWDSPAFAAGLTAGTGIVSVNGAPFTHSALRSAIAAAAERDLPIRLHVANAGHERTVAIPYRGGLRYPRITRAEDTRDRLAEILAPR